MSVEVVGKRFDILSSTKRAEIQELEGYAEAAEASKFLFDFDYPLVITTPKDQDAKAKRDQSRETLRQMLQTIDKKIAELGEGQEALKRGYEAAKLDYQRILDQDALKEEHRIFSIPHLVGDFFHDLNHVIKDGGYIYDGSIHRDDSRYNFFESRAVAIQNELKKLGENDLVERLRAAQIAKLGEPKSAENDLNLPRVEGRTPLLLSSSDFMKLVEPLFSRSRRISFADTQQQCADLLAQLDLTKDHIDMFIYQQRKGEDQSRWHYVVRQILEAHQIIKNQAREYLNSEFKLWFKKDEAEYRRNVEAQKPKDYQQLLEKSDESLRKIDQEMIAVFGKVIESVEEGVSIVQGFDESELTAQLKETEQHIEELEDSIKTLKAPEALDDTPVTFSQRAGDTWNQFKGMMQRQKVPTRAELKTEHAKKVQEHQTQKDQLESKLKTAQAQQATLSRKIQYLKAVEEYQSYIDHKLEFSDGQWLQELLGERDHELMVNNVRPRQGAIGA